jgi:GNAT superfamily N-acetyltransferase
VDDVVIRWAEPSDLDVLRDVYRRSSLWNEGDRDALLANPDALVFDGSRLHEQRTRVATVNGVVVGFATTVPPDGDGDADGEGALELEDLFTDPDWMRRGVGLALVRDAVALGRAWGAARIEVTANPHASVFYDRAGFVPAGTVDTRFGPGARMRLELTR